MRGELTLFGMTVAWGFSFVVVKWALADSGFVTLTALRMSLGFLTLLLLARPGLRAATRIEWRAGVGAGLCLCGGYFLQTGGMVTADAGVSGFLTAAYVPLVPLLEALIYRRSPPLRDLAVLLLATAGITLIALEGDFGVSFGDLLVALSSLCWAAQIVIVGRFARRVGARRFASIQILTVAIVATLLLPVVAEGVPRATPSLGACVVYLGCVSCALCILLQAWGQREVTPTRAAILFSGEPVFAALFGLWLQGDRFEDRDIAGAALVMLAIVATLVARRRAPPIRNRADEGSSSG